MKEYKLTFTMTIKAQDDPAARKESRNILDAVGQVAPDTEAKLQQVYKDKPPRGVKIA